MKFLYEVRPLAKKGKQLDSNAELLKRIGMKEANAEDGIGTEYLIPFIKDKAITLTNAGSLTGARLSTNMLDTIAKYAGLAHLPIQSALGIPAKETTFGNPTDNKGFFILSGMKKAAKYIKTQQNINNNGDAVSPKGLGNFYENYNPYTQLLAEANRRKQRGEDFYQALREGEGYADRMMNSDYYKHGISTPAMQLAFERFRNKPYSYNPGQSNYPQLVEKKGREALNSPEIQQWWNTSGQRFYNDPNGYLPFVDNGWSKVDFIPNTEVRVNPKTGGVYTNNINEGAVILPEVNIHPKGYNRRTFKYGGIHINPANRGKLTATAKRTGKSFEELAHSDNPLTRKRAIFALNARKWHH